MLKKKLPIDVSSFEILIKGNYLYIDKTEHIYKLVNSGRIHFLARPRRFGKSLLVSTLEELFKGNRELFKGLWIDSSDYSWEEHPVISLNFSTFNNSSPQKLQESLALSLELHAKEHGIDISQTSEPIDKLVLLVNNLTKINKVVILIGKQHLF